MEKIQGFTAVFVCQIEYSCEGDAFICLTVKSYSRI